MECSLRKNRGSCNCTYEPCSKKGRCCECIEYHRGMGQLPACLFPDDIESTYDRSIRKFIETHK